MNAPLHREMPGNLLDSARALNDVTQAWDSTIVPELKNYIEIPAKSPAFDADWAAHGHIESVLRRAAQWVETQKVEGLTLEIIQLPGRTPVMFFEVAATRAASEGSGQTVLMYGHLDKQPEFNGWRNDLGPWTPVYEDGKLYGRGGADDGYAVYASIAAVQALKAQKTPHPRIVGLIETCEESGSYDLLPYVDALRTRMGDVGLVICLDSGAGNYDQLWLTTSLRGMASGTLKVQILTEGIHSGDASGLVPSSFRIMRQVLDRPLAARQLPLRSACRAIGASAGHRRHLGRRGVQAFPVGALRLRRLHHLCPAHHHRPDTSLAQPHLDTHTERDRGGRFSGAERRGQCAAPLHRLQTQPALAPPGGRRASRGRDESPARRQRALPGQSHL